MFACVQMSLIMPTGEDTIYDHKVLCCALNAPMFLHGATLCYSPKPTFQFQSVMGTTLGVKSSQSFIQKLNGSSALKKDTHPVGYLLMWICKGDDPSTLTSCVK